MENQKENTYKPDAYSAGIDKLVHTINILTCEPCGKKFRDVIDYNGHLYCWDCFRAFVGEYAIDENKMCFVQDAVFHVRTDMTN